MKNKQNKKSEFISYSDFRKETLKKPGVKKAYNELQFEFTIIRALIESRSKKNMTQKKLAKKIGVDQSALARFESGRVNPTLAFVSKVAQGLGLKLMVR